MTNDGTTMRIMAQKNATPSAWTRQKEVVVGAQATAVLEENARKAKAEVALIDKVIDESEDGTQFAKLFGFREILTGKQNQTQTAKLSLAPALPILVLRNMKTLRQSLHPMKENLLPLPMRVKMLSLRLQKNMKTSHL